MSNLDADFKSEIRRFDSPMILACNRHKATILPVRLRYNSSGYKAGEVISRNTGDGLYDKYADGASSGLGTANAILLAPQSALSFGSGSGSGSQAVQGCFAGEVYYDKLVGIDANGITDLGGKKITDGTGTNILIF